MKFFFILSILTIQIKVVYRQHSTVQSCLPVAGKFESGIARLSLAESSLCAIARSNHSPVFNYFTTIQHFNAPAPTDWSLPAFFLFDTCKIFLLVLLKCNYRFFRVTDRVERPRVPRCAAPPHRRY